ncbi:GntR family transcriptional regulator [Scopulibacillus darangshiensis]|uniref:GntR family transcriptional regulator n=1 Tax=Scopulibacillus darangshiensis TaxID=442528 RepID=A0A4R2NH33_9BACL|nr:FadR/GntR family transcriptional regulator [Scopulibacillus darangshiensis]TCP20651.1 GntR family transcriptional regulator [Scopulibacillus darangshiensis]
MTFKPIRKRRVYHEVIEQIMSAIERGDIHPGSKFPSERQLAEKLSVSRTTIKEAISVMESSGTVIVRPGVGTFLREVNTEDILHRLNIVIQNHTLNIVELMEIRQAIEGSAAYFAALRATEGELLELETKYHDLAASVHQEKLAAEEDYAFHMTILTMAKNDLMVNMMNLLSERLKKGLVESRTETLGKKGKATIVLEEHKVIAEAIAAGDCGAAREAMWHHLQNVKTRFI